MSKPSLVNFVLERFHKISGILLGVAIAIVIALKIFRDFQLPDFVFNQF